VGHVSQMGEITNAHDTLAGKPEGKWNHSEDPGVDGTIILEWMLGADWMHLVQERDQWQALCEHSNESSSTKHGEFLEYLCDY